MELDTKYFDELYAKEGKLLHFSKDWKEVLSEAIDHPDAKPVDITEKYIRIRMKQPSLFADASFRTIDISKPKGIKAIIGKLKSDPNGSTQVQSYLFDKEKFTTEEAKKWVEENKDFTSFLVDEREDDIITFGDRTPQPKTKVYACEIKNFNDQTRSFDAVASTEEKDRDGDVLEVAGWQLKNYRKNPIVLWKHNPDIPAIAKTTNIWKEKGVLMFTPQFASADIHPFADQIYKLYKGGFLRSFSVRFDPFKWEDMPKNEGEQRQYFGRKYKLQDLLEISCVNVPANAGCLVSRDYQDMIVKSFQLSNLKTYSPEEQQIILKGAGIANKPEPKYLIREEDEKEIAGTIENIKKLLAKLETLKGIEVIKQNVDEIIDETKKDLEEGKIINDLFSTIKQNSELLSKIGQ
jgi:hypothetical protein